MGKYFLQSAYSPVPYRLGTGFGVRFRSRFLCIFGFIHVFEGWYNFSRVYFPAHTRKLDFRSNAIPTLEIDSFNPPWLLISE
jgi:hypothetical protein